MTQAVKRPSVNYAKDWLDQLFLFPGLEKGFIYGGPPLEVVAKARGQ